MTAYAYTITTSFPVPKVGTGYGATVVLFSLGSYMTQEVPRRPNTLSVNYVGRYFINCVFIMYLCHVLRRYYTDKINLLRVVFFMWFLSNFMFT